MKKPEAWTAYDQGDPVYVYDVSEADEYSNALEAALEEAVGLLREAMEIVEGDYEAARGRDSETGNNIRAFLDKHGKEDQ